MSNETNHRNPSKNRAEKENHERFSVDVGIINRWGIVFRDYLVRSRFTY